MKKYSLFLLSSLLLLTLLVPVNSFAQLVAEDVDPNPTGSECLTLTSTALRYKSRDAEVFSLQDFLQSQGYLKSEPTGYFGLLTLKAVKDFQSANGINPTGYVGPVTRAKIKDISCGGGIVKPPRCTSGVLYNPTTGKPCVELPPGCASTVGYSPITGKKCSETGTVTPTTTSNNVVIDEVSGPQTLKVGETGTWTVKAHTKDGAGVLSYGVIWGDEYDINGLRYKAEFPSETRQSTTFTHSYAKQDTYTLTFIVSTPNTIRCITTPCPSNAGSAKTSITVKVGSTSSSVTAPYITDTSTKKGLQGFDPVTGLYDNTQAVAGKYLVLYGKFDSTGNKVWVGNKEYVPTYQSTTQLNVLLGSETGTMQIAVKNGTKTSNTLPFTIVAPSNSTTPSITVVSPNGGEKLVHGDTQTIKWTSANLGSAKIGIRLYDKNGSPVTTLARGIANTGSVDLVIPSTYTGNYVVMVYTETTDVVSDKSDASFSFGPSTAAPYINYDYSTDKKGIQGFDAAANTYNDTQAVAGKYLVLYGNFDSTGNTVVVGSNVYTPIYQSTSQINVLLGSQTGNLQVLVKNGSKKSQVYEFKVVAQ